MLDLALFGILTWITIYSIGQLFVVAAFVRVFRKPAGHVGNHQPKAAVILALRGADPSMERNIRALLQQDYPDYNVFIVVDHVEDTAWPIVRAICDSMPDVAKISVVNERLGTCSLKCSALVQAVTALDKSYEVIAFADGDTLVHRTWLQELAEPLSDPEVGVATGARWYLPSDAGLGSMTRYFWNAGAVVQIWLNGFAWPGSMAIRASVLREAGIVAAWRTSLFDGPTVVQQVRQAGYHIRFVPSVMIVNRERISLSDFSSWVERQAVVARSLGSDWYLLAVHAVNIVVCVIAPALALLSPEPGLSRLALIAALSYWGVTILSAVVLESTVRTSLAVQDHELEWFDWKKALNALPSLLLVHFVVLRAFAFSVVRRRIHWRGISYEIRTRNDVRMLNYVPFRLASTEPDQSVI